MLILSSPSGAGKTTISRALLERHRDLIMSVSVTTRHMRPGELNGVDYHYVDQHRFDEMILANELLEHAVVFDNSYGTLRQPVMEVLNVGQDVLFDVDWQGAKQIRENAAEDFVSIFILPPSVEELERRLRTRGQDSDDEVKRRMGTATAEMSHWADYEYIVINDDIEKSVAEVSSILVAERLKRRRQIGVTDVMRNLGVAG